MHSRVRRMAFSVLFLGGVMLPGAPVPGSPPAEGFTAGPLSNSDVDSMMAAACGVIRRRLEALVRPGGAVDANCRAAVPASRSPAYDDGEAAALRELRNLRSALAGVSEEYTDAHATVWFIDTRLAGPVATLTVEEDSQLTYALITGNEPQLTAWSDQRTFTFRWNGDGWELIRQALAGGGMRPVDEPAGVSLQQMLDSLAESQD